MGNEHSGPRKAAAEARQKALDSHKEGRMNRSMTVDERHMLSAPTRRQDTDFLLEKTFPKLKKAVTFVSKKNVSQVKQLTLDDVMYRKHFNEAPAHEHAHPVLHEMAIVPTEEAVSTRMNKAVIVVDTFSTGVRNFYIFPVQCTFPD